MQSAEALPTPIDLSAVDTLTDDQLTTELLIAETNLRTARARDPRRTSLAYSDAKLAVDVLSREQRTRTAAAQVLAHRIRSAAATVEREINREREGVMPRTGPAPARPVFPALPLGDDEEIL